MRRDGLLLAVCIGTGLFGLALVLLPGLARQGFSLLIFGQTGRIDVMPAEARDYITLLHGVLGAVMLGWAVALVALLRGRWRVPTAQACSLIACSVGVWFVVDTSWSLWCGAWQNALLNLVFGLGFAIALLIAARAGAPAARSRT